MFFKLVPALLLFPFFGIAQEVSLAQAAEELSKQLPAGGIVTADGAEFSESGKFKATGIPPEKRLFEIGSISKVFTGLLLTQAVVEEKVTLDTPISTLLGDLKFKDPRVGKITLRDLASHTSGLPRLPGNLWNGASLADPYAHYDRASLDQALASLQLASDPPYDSSYSNLGVGLLGDLLSRLYGKSWEDLVHEKVTSPLKMRDTVVTLSADQKKRLAQPHAGAKVVSSWQFKSLAGAGALGSTAVDMITFAKALVEPEKTPLESAIKLLVKSRSADGKHGLSLGHYSGYGEQIMGHNGGTGGYRSQLEVIPATKAIRVILINNTTLDPSLIIARAKGEMPNLPKPGRALSPEKLAEYPGVYLIEAAALKGSKFTVIQKGDELWGKLSGQSYLRFHSTEKADHFAIKEVEAEYQFGREDGKITSLTLLQNGQKILSRRTDEALPEESKNLPISKEEAAEYLGSYQLAPQLKFTVTFASGNLMASLTGQPSLPVFRKSKDRFEYQAVEAALEFERNKAGKITALKLHQNGAIQRAPKK